MELVEPGARPSALGEYPAVIRIPIQWGDQDAFGHVNNVAAIRWFESSRVAYLEQGGMEMMLHRGGLGPILASVTCHYRRQLTYPDIVLVGGRVSRLGSASMTIEHAVYSQMGGAVAADGISVVVAFDYATQRPVRIPDELRRAVERLEGRRL